jgi:hypothetical protein
VSKPACIPKSAATGREKEFACGLSTSGIVCCTRGRCRRGRCKRGCTFPRASAYSIVGCCTPTSMLESFAASAVPVLGKPELGCMTNHVSGQSRSWHRNPFHSRIIHGFREVPHILLVHLLFNNFLHVGERITPLGHSGWSSSRWSPSVSVCA